MPGKQRGMFDNVLARSKLMVGVTYKQGGPASPVFDTGSPVAMDQRMRPAEVVRAL